MHSISKYGQETANLLEAQFATNVETKFAEKDTKTDLRIGLEMSR